MIFTELTNNSDPLPFNDALKFFTDSVRFWAEVLGLHGYEVCVGTRDTQDSLASFSINEAARTIYIYLSRNSSVVNEPNDFNHGTLFRSALHEVLEALLYEPMLILRDTDRGMESKQAALEAHRHSIVHRLSPLLCSCTDAETFSSDYDGAGV